MTTATCKRCKETIKDVKELKYKIESCETGGCKAKTHKFQKHCAGVFECSPEDFIPVTEINLVFHPVKLPQHFNSHQNQLPFIPITRQGIRSWLCINAPMYDCTCGNMPGLCEHFEHYGYGG